MEALGSSVIGALKNYGGRFDPGNGWYLADGRELSRTGFSALFAAICPTIGAVTASGATLTLANHQLVVGDSLYFISTGTLPAGLSANTLYYVSSVPTANTFTVSASISAAGPGASITTTNAGTGVHSVVFCPYGLGDGATTFNLPDYRGRSTLTPAAGTGRLPNSVSALGRSESGEEQHLLTAAQSGAVAHAHGGATGTGVSGTGTTPLTNILADADSGVHAHGANVGTGNQSANHGHSIPFSSIVGTTDGAANTSTVHTNADGTNPSIYQSKTNAGSHGHGVPAGNTSGEDTNHSHSFSVPAQAIPAQGVPAQTISTQAAAAAASAHNNIPPSLSMNKIIRAL